MNTKEEKNNFLKRTVLERKKERKKETKKELEK